MRILLTISRTWDDWYTVDLVFDSLPPDAVLVHGDCLEGDRDAAARWQARGGRVEARPANWDGPCDPAFCKPGHRRPNRRGGTSCPAAGFRRNEHMVALGADLCIAFIRDHSKGATHCADIAEKAGIRTLRFHQDGQP